jgi:PLP dependent protein
MTPFDLGTLAPSPPVEVVAGRVEQLRGRIVAAGRDPGTVRIVAVTKGFGIAAVEAALASGITEIGENRADELLAKVAAGAGGAAASPGPHWHYLGAIQRRRVPALAPVVGLWQTVARPAEGAVIATHAPGAPVLVQVNAAGSPGQNGCSLSEVPGLVERLRTLALDVRGLMLLAPQGPADEVRRLMRSLAHSAADLHLPELSMGMTDDLDEALAEGATIVRVGRGLFGGRAPEVPLRQD